MQPRKILFFVDDFRGGAGNVVQIISKGLASQGFIVTVCCVSGNTPGRHDLNGVNVLRISCCKKGYLKYCERIRKIRNIISKERPDCVISFLFGVSALVGVAMIGCKIPLISSERSDPFSLKPHGVIVPFLHYAYRKSSKIVVLFDAFRALEDGKYYNKTATISNPVPELPNYVHSIQDSNIRYFTMANYSEPKGYDVLINSFIKILDKNPTAVLNIYGKDDSDKLKNLVVNSKLDKSVFLKGYSLDIEKALCENDVYVMASRHEGFPNALCEAMAAGKACIATECHEGIREIISDGENGLLVKANDVDSLTNAMIYLSDNPSLIFKLGSSAKSISEKYSKDKIISQWIDIIDGCTNIKNHK